MDGQIFAGENLMCSIPLRLLARIREIIRDPDLDDGACFEKIEEIVCLFEEYGIAAGTRHDFG